MKETERTIKQEGDRLRMTGLYTVFNLVLILFTLLFSWEKWVIFLMAASVVAVWTIHIGQIGTARWQISLCAAFLLLEAFFFGVHEDSFQELTVVFCVLLLALTVFGERKLVYCAVAVYLADFLYQICFLGLPGADAGRTDFARLFLGLAAVGGSAVLAEELIRNTRAQREQAERFQEKLEAVNSRSEDFLANVSHELRTPINAVTGISDLVLQKKLPSDLQADLVAIQQAGKRLAAQINNILDYTDMTAGRLKVSEEDYLIASSINDMVAMANVQNQESGLELVFDVDPLLPCVLIGDETKIRRVVKILVENAVKFTEKGGICVRIGCRRTDYGINLGIDIHDTGIGMSKEEMTRVYDEFYQVDSGRSRKAGGLGLGLPMAHGLVHAMGGFMSIGGDPGGGTQIQIRIPQRVADERPCMTIREPETLCAACFLGAERYTGAVRDYYHSMLVTLVRGLGVKIQRISQFSELPGLRQSARLTHLFVDQEEYEKNPDFYEEYGREICVALIAEQGYRPAEGSSLHVMYKPFYGLAIVNVLNENRGDRERSADYLEGLCCDGVRALVVDDDPMNLTVARGIFLSYGMEVDTCPGGPEALEACRQNRYDVVFLDHMMPGMDGVETLRRLRVLDDGLYREIPVIALTANAVSGAREMFKDEGFDEFVAKPIERSVLERVLRRTLPGKCRRGRAQARGGAADGGKVRREQAETAGKRAPGPESAAAISGNATSKAESGVPSAYVVTESGRAMSETGVQGMPGAVTERASAVGARAVSEPGSGPVVAAGNSARAVSKSGSETAIVTEPAAAADTQARPEPGTGTEPAGKKAAGRTEAGMASAAGAGTTSEAERGGEEPVLSFLRQNGFDVKRGIGYCADSEEFYLEMLGTFYRTAEQRKAEIVSGYEAQDWENYTIKVHALKSASRTIGAESLFACAAGLESAGKSRDVAYIGREHPALLALFAECCRLIGEGTGECGKAEEQEVSGGETAGEACAGADAEVDEETWRTVLLELAAAVETYESERVEAVIGPVTGRARHGRPCGELFAKLREAVEEFDFETAGSELCRIQEEEGAV